MRKDSVCGALYRGPVLHWGSDNAGVVQFVQTRQCLKASLLNAITLVSRRWHRIFYSEPELWRSLHLTARSLTAAAAAGQAQQWFASKSTLLHRVGGFVQHLVLADRRQTVGAGAGAQWASMQQLADQYGGWHLSSSVLAHLSPGALQSLRLHCEAVDEAAAAALQHFSGLLQLNLHCEGDVPSCVAAALPSLPQLQHLELAGSTMPQGLPAALQQLPQLCEQSRQLAWPERCVPSHPAAGAMVGGCQAAGPDARGCAAAPGAAAPLGSVGRWQSHARLARRQDPGA